MLTEERLAAPTISTQSPLAWKEILEAAREILRQKREREYQMSKMIFDNKHKAKGLPPCRPFLPVNSHLQEREGK